MRNCKERMASRRWKQVDVGNNVKKVQNDERNTDVSNTLQAARIAAKKNSTYAEAVKKHNVNFLKSINEHISLNRNNPFSSTTVVS